MSAGKIIGYIVSGILIFFGVLWIIAASSGENTCRFPLFHSYFDFPQGLPKVHEHDGKRPQALGLFDGDRLMVLYTYESDLGDGWEDEEVHHDPAPVREAALKMGVNIIYYALSQ